MALRAELFPAGMPRVAGIEDPAMLAASMPELDLGYVSFWQANAYPENYVRAEWRAKKTVEGLRDMHLHKNILLVGHAITVNYMVLRCEYFVSYNLLLSLSIK